jgi:hypothetical protein
MAAKVMARYYPTALYLVKECKRDKDFFTASAD